MTKDIEALKWEVRQAICCTSEHSYGYGVVGTTIDYLHQRGLLAAPNHVVVPREASIDMCRAGLEAVAAVETDSLVECAVIYKAMIAAIPGADQTDFILNDEQFKQMEDKLNEPPKVKRGLKTLLDTPVSEGDEHG